jgi:hypothetical protein
MFIFTYNKLKLIQDERILSNINRSQQSTLQNFL